MTELQIEVMRLNDITEDDLQGHPGNQSCGRIEINARGEWVFNWYTNFCDPRPCNSRSLIQPDFDPTNYWQYEKIV